MKTIEDFRTECVFETTGSVDGLCEGGFGCFNTELATLRVSPGGVIERSGSDRGFGDAAEFREHCQLAIHEKKLHSLALYWSPPLKGHSPAN